MIIHWPSNSQVCVQPLHASRYGSSAVTLHYRDNCIPFTQHEAHTSALRLQRHSLETTLAIERAQALEHENAATHAELAVLRAHPDTTPRPAELQLPELTLALRRASDKLTLAEDALRIRTTELANMQGAAARAHYAAENAFSLAARARAHSEDAGEREHALTLRLRAAEEESRMTDRAVREYADLVRRLERRQSLPSSPPPSARSRVSNGRASEQVRDGTFEALQEEKASLHKLAGEFADTNKALRDEIGKLQVDLEGTRAELEAERRAAEKERVQLSNALMELERAKHDDNTAAKMVSRYMYVSLTPLLSLLTLTPPQEVLPGNNRYPTESPRVSQSAPHCNNVHTARATRVRTSRTRH
jgi:hypothetical protein